MTKTSTDAPMEKRGVVEKGVTPREKNAKEAPIGESTNTRLTESVESRGNRSTE